MIKLRKKANQIILIEFAQLCGFI